MWQTVIHTIFILSALGIAWTDRVMNPANAHKPKAKWREVGDADHAAHDAQH
jgi:hypothetical protein